MFRAGLAFSAPIGGHDANGAGVLSAAEAAMLDLGRTRWLVLSGCDTGSGPVAGREGVLGLRRAFAIAGARTQFVSVWGVRDDDCREWMRALYHARFVERRSTVEAARAASLRMLARRRALRLPPSPATWAGFVAVGDWR
jgi:CHAT domain-containing protein